MSGEIVTILFYTCFFSVPLGIFGLLNIVKFVKELLLVRKGYSKIHELLPNGQWQTCMLKESEGIFESKKGMKGTDKKRFEIDTQARTHEGLIPVYSYTPASKKPINFFNFRSGLGTSQNEIDKIIQTANETGILEGMKQDKNETKFIILAMLASIVAAFCGLWSFVSSISHK